MGTCSSASIDGPGRPPNTSAAATATATDAHASPTTTATTTGQGPPPPMSQKARHYEEDLSAALRRRASLAEIRAIVEQVDDDSEKDHDQHRQLVYRNRRESFLAMSIDLRSEPDVVAFLVSTWPSALLDPDAVDGTLPLQAMIQRRMLDAVIAVLKTADVPAATNVVEAALQRPDRYRQLPLHMAARMAHPELVKAVAEAWPPALHIRGNRGRLPLHVIAASEAVTPDGDALRTVQYLVGAHLGAVRVADDDGRWPFHCAIGNYHNNISDNNNNNINHRNRRSTDVIEYLLTQSPRALLVPDREGRVPLHIAAADYRFRVTRPLVERLVDAEPTAVRVQDRHGQTPVDVALSNPWCCCSAVHLRPRLSIVPDLRHLGGGYHHPLHDSDTCPGCHARSTVAVVQDLVNNAAARRRRRRPRRRSPTDDDPLVVQDVRGRTPLHVAASWPCEEGAREAIEFLASRSPPEALVRQDNDQGRTPLHIVLERHGTDGNVIRRLLDLGPGALRLPDHRGQLPLHVVAAALTSTACLRNKQQAHAVLLRVLEDVANAWEGALRVRDAMGRLPVHVAAESGASLDVIYALLRMFPPALE